MKIIACVDENYGIGNKGELLYHLRQDLIRFKEYTMGNTVIMGRVTQETLPNKKLSHRHNVVLTHDTSLHSDDPQVEYVTSIQEIIDRYSRDPNAYVIGGENVYRQLIHHSNGIFLTKVKDKSKECDRRFPAIHHKDWYLMYKSQILHDDKEDVDYWFEDYLSLDHRFAKFHTTR